MITDRSPQDGRILIDKRDVEFTSSSGRDGISLSANLTPPAPSRAGLLLSSRLTPLLPPFRHRVSHLRRNHRMRWDIIVHPFANNSDKT
ncbi:hypothetical protein J6590_094224 [Homalodisca vitripennis]|nr:hypothetical protein J6590_094224 [Homalodisca vitripennis]